MNLDISKDPEQLSKRFADWMIHHINVTLETQDRFVIALSGGTTPRKLYDLLASEEYKSKIDWAKIHFFWGDERYVPFEDDRNNAKMAFDTLLDHVPANKQHIHIMRTDLSPEESCIAYEKILSEYFRHKKYSFDLVLLGLGDNAHTLSLFPGYDILHEKENWVKAFYLEEQKMYRITLTAPLVNRAACVAFLVAGSDKAEALDNVMYGRRDPELYPAQLIHPFNDELYWFIDEQAAIEIL